MRSLALVVPLLAFAGCGVSPLSLLKPGGANVAANVQLGKTNAQVLGEATFSEQKLINPEARTIEQSAGDTQVRTERVETLVVNQGAPLWVWLIALVGWLVPTPTAIGVWAWQKITRKKQEVTLWRDR